MFREKYSLFYDALYRDKDYEKESDFIQEILSKGERRAKKILDLGCGTGGHSLILAKRGYHVVGVDRSKNMIEIAKRKAEGADLSVQFIENDISAFDLQEKFDAVTAMFAVISYQTTNEALSNSFKTARKHLNPGGIFLFDCWNGLAVMNEKPKTRIKEVALQGKKIIRFTQPVLDTINHIVEIKFRVWEIENNHVTNETEESHFMRFLFPQEIKYFLEVAGFSKVEFHPFLDSEGTLTEHDWNMTVTATV